MGIVMDWTLPAFAWEGHLKLRLQTFNVQGVPKNIGNLVTNCYELTL